MDLSPPSTPADPSNVDDFLRTLAAQRQRVQQFMAAQRERLEAITVELTGRIEQYQADVRELRTRNTDLEHSLAGRVAVASRDQPVGGLNWELEKERILAALEAEGNPTTPPRTAERLRIEEVLRVTDQALASKEHEIQQLRQQLENSRQVAAETPGDPAARDEILDRDVVISEERENLKRLQQYWEEMLRQAEIDLSLERARLARERAEIDEKLRRLPPEEAASGVKKPVRGRWLARLGLTDEQGEGETRRKGDQEKGRPSP